MDKLKPGVLQPLTSNIRRITAPNGNIMTGPGTNTYVVGNRELAVIDPGPLEQVHVDAIIDSCKPIGNIKWVLVTHAHTDHSPAAKVLAELTDAKLMGPGPIVDEFQDSTYKPAHEFGHNEIFRTDEFTIRALHTPGHVGNHFCYLIEEEDFLITGDHIMNGSTVVIIPPSGDMKDYINSLLLLKDYTLKSLGPGHGDVITDPYGEIQKIIDHRMAREKKVMAGMQELRTTTLDELTQVVYDDVDVALHPIAQFSLLAHLLKLQKDSRVFKNGDYWSLH